MLDSVPLGLLQFVRLTEANGIEQLKQTRIGARMPVMRRCAEEEFMLEVGGDLPEHLAEAAIVAKRRRHQVMALVHDQKVPWQIRRVLGRLTGRAELLKDIVLTKVVIRSN